MIGEVALVLSALKALNDGIATVRESKGNLSSIVGKWAEADEKVRDVEVKKTGKMSYKEALDMESAKRQLANFDQQLKDICMMQGQYDLYTSIKSRMEESRLQHVKDVARMRKKRKELKELMNFLGVITVSVVFLWVVAYAGFMIWKGYRRELWKALVTSVSATPASAGIRSSGIRQEEKEGTQRLS